MIARRKRASKGRRQEYSYSPMIWINGEDRHQIWGGTFRTKAEAKAEERRLIDERDAGKNLKPVKITVAELFDQYINDKRNKVKASTLQRSEELLAHLRPIIGSAQATALKPATISKAYNTLQQNLSKRTVRHCHWQLHGALDLAVNWGQIATNPAARVEPPEPDEFEGRALNHNELKKLLEAVTGTDLEAIVWLALDSGARQGELLALSMDDGFQEGGFIHIGRSVRRLRGQGMVFTAPKTKLSKRTVEIAPATIPVLKAHRTLQLENRLKAGDLWDQEQNLFFSTSIGEAMDGVGITKAFQKIAKDAGLGAIRFHDLRHSSVSFLLEAGAKMDDVRARVGHSSITTTVNTYGHRIAGSGSLGASMDGILAPADKDPDAWLANG